MRICGSLYVCDDFNSISDLRFTYSMQYGLLIPYMKEKANARSNDPLRSPNAVK